jgi:spermidine synthase
MPIRLAKVAALLCGSGMCALIYQVTWLRELRLVFGSSTPASACVLAVFMGGLGLGGAILGRYADRHPRPLAFYSNLESLIAVSAGLSPFLIWTVRTIYIGLGGSMVLGMSTAVIVRLALSCIVLGIPTFLMGGTLPAAGRAVETAQDANRRNMAVLYGLNTLGAVLGASFATFYMLEIFGTRNTVWLAALLNMLVAVFARKMARGLSSDTPLPAMESKPEADARVAKPSAFAQTESGPFVPSLYVLAAAGIVGFAFLLMELVWYRMLGPLLGGSTYTFGLILAVALLGIGLGGAAYAPLAHRGRARLSGFALTVGLEAVCVGIPLALGDRVAVLSDALRDLGSLGFYGYVTGWFIVTALVILPAAVVSGFQFPMLIALLGEGKHNVGKQIGLAYAWNTAGAIIGSLAGGFGLLPMLTAPGTWRAVVLMLAALGAVAAVLSIQSERKPFRTLLPLGAAALAVLLALLPDGPTVAWRHTGIGAGRSTLQLSDRTVLRNSMHFTRRNIVWEADGLESSVALLAEQGYAFVVNGKIDGNAITDISTQVMLGMLSAILHPDPRRAMVIGLGTGSSAGWLGEIDSMERVDVVELEPAILEVARRCTPVNANVLTNPKVRVIIGDGREVLLTAPEHYDLIVSEPSNPYRAGIASLYTKEFFQAVAQRLRQRGIFTQWVQAYEIDASTVRTIYATLASVFSFVETWQANTSDMLLLCSQTPIEYSYPRLCERIQQEPFKSTLLRSWHAADIETFLAHYVARPSFAQEVARETPWINTDDLTLVEFGFARTLGQENLFEIAHLLNVAKTRGEERPDITDGVVQWETSEERRFYMIDSSMTVSDSFTGELGARLRAYSHFLRGNPAKVLAEWQAQSKEPACPVERIMVAEALANAGNDAALPIIEAIRADWPTDTSAILARLYWNQGKSDQAVEALVNAFTRYRLDPWAFKGVMMHALDLAEIIALQNKVAARQLAEAVKVPFCVRALDELRHRKALAIASQVDFSFAASFVEAFEPHTPWEAKFLCYRYDCYNAIGHPLKDLAKKQAIQILTEKPQEFTLTPKADEEDVGLFGDKLRRTVKETNVSVDASGSSRNE